MIADLLENYKRFNNDTEVRILRSFVINGHEVAWMEYTYELRYSNGEPKQFSTRGVGCECDFTEGVGWYIKDSQRFTTDADRKCLPRKAAVYLRQMELCAEYKERFDSQHFGNFYRCIDKIVLDMIAKAQAGEMIEDGAGAAAYGGYFYVQSIAAITGEYMGHLWEKLYPMMQNKQISLDGCVVKSYTEPPPPQWEEFLRFEVDGFLAIAKLPSHRQMAQEWKYEIYRDSEDEPCIRKSGDRLLHDPVFGPDVEDVERARTGLTRTVQEIIRLDAREKESELK